MVTERIIAHVGEMCCEWSIIKLVANCPRGLMWRLRRCSNVETSATIHTSEHEYIAQIDHNQLTYNPIMGRPGRYRHIYVSKHKDDEKLTNYPKYNDIDRLSLPSREVVGVMLRVDDRRASPMCEVTRSIPRGQQQEPHEAFRVNLSAVSSGILHAETCRAAESAP